MKFHQKKPKKFYKISLIKIQKMAIKNPLNKTC